MEIKTMEVDQQVDINAPAAKVFESFVKQISDGFAYPDGTSMNMKIERHPGGRWYRDLGDGNGHLWGTVQSFKFPNLIEITGQTCMSYPAANHISARFTETDGKTRLHFVHRAFGFLADDHRNGMPDGWKEMIDAVKKELEG